MNRIYQPLYKSSSKKKYLCRFSNTMKEGFLYEHCAKKVFETMAHYFVNLCSTNQFLEMLWRRRQQQQKKVCLIIMEASHAVLRQMMLSLELWLLSCWLYLITDESGRLLESGEALELRCSIGHHRRWQQQRKQRWATQQQPVLVGLMRAKNTIFHILRPFISSLDAVMLLLCGDRVENVLSSCRGKCSSHFSKKGC